MLTTRALALTCLLCGVAGQDPVTLKFSFLIEEGQDDPAKWLQESLRLNEQKNELFSFDAQVVEVGHDDEDENKICNGFSGGSKLIVDATWAGNERAKTLADNLQVPYVRVDLSISPFLGLMDKYLSLRNSTDVVVIFDDPRNIDQSLYHWIDSTRLRILVSDKLDKIAAQRLKVARPLPNSYAIVATTTEMADSFRLATREGLVKLPERWNLVFLDFNYANFPKTINVNDVNLLKIERAVCCRLQGLGECSCRKDFALQQQFLTVFLEQMAMACSKLISRNYDLLGEVSCPSNSYNVTIVQQFGKLLTRAAVENGNFWELNGAYRLKVDARVEVGTFSEKARLVARYDENQDLVVEDDVEIVSVRPYYRVGITEAVPWTYQEEDRQTGKMRWTGYCIDLIEELAKLMNFGYELVVPENGDYGTKDANGKWNGLIGDLVKGETDIAMAALIMTADREEVVDYVAPYFEQSGISIVMRKPVLKTSFFKFMTVLKLEVWLSIVAALMATAVMLWFLDKYSPYSARNNKKAYPYPTRTFTLKESFWFALTSFTPQGGGEAPKSLSARTLVAAYWLFVVLMLATFTANLAAFLTVERMQTPVQSLEQLSRQSRINYTVVMESMTHQYFINMKYAEDTLYRMWKELTLNASSSEKRYRVWDYPIREQYGHILLAINASVPVANASEGFRITNERLDSDFAFIHDSPEIKYEVSKNCNFTEIGEVFAEKPYAIAVQQGSHLQDEISIKILDLQRDRFFEHLQEKYWNYSRRGDCTGALDSEGITLESLGGVFIATLFGLALAMITLVIEVLYYKRKFKRASRKNATEKPGKKTIVLGPETVTIGKTFKPNQGQRLTPKMSKIKVYPRNRLSSQVD